MTSDFDFLIIGAGASGAAAGYHLAKLGKTVILEAEDMPGYHSTGRSAALFTRNYGPAAVRAVSAVSYDFFQSPPEGFTDHPLLTPRGGLSIAFKGDEKLLDKVKALGTAAHPIHEVTLAEAMQLAPLLRADLLARAVYEPGVLDMDVDAIHRGFLKGFAARGGQVITDRAVTALSREGDAWQVTTAKGSYRATIVINAAGAWADRIGQLAGAKPIGLTPKRRTAILIDPPTGIDIGTMPLVDFAGGEIYIKPTSGKIMASPGDETPVEPQDIQPDDMDVAVLADWLERHTAITIRRIDHSWAGLRSFVADGVPVVGFDPRQPDFFWLAGQGGFGIMMSAALGQLTAALVSRAGLPAEFVAQGLRESDLAPARCQL
ncbi:MAG TPA: FAD-binding oxidoreductase [Dongiaceae bacterium]|nr:FAD-binding oxidoreductase [Dongiaceae bacterium]